MTRALVIIAAAHLEEARALLQQAPFNYTPETAAGTFRPAGSLTGAEPATHHWLSAQMSAEKWAACEQLCAAFAWAWCWAYDLQTEPRFPWEALEALGIEPLIVEVGP